MNETTPTGATGTFGLPTADVAGIPVAVTSFGGAVDWLIERAHRHDGVGVRLINAYSIVSAHRDPQYLRVMQDSGVSLPDGTPVAAALRLFAGQPGAGRVRGPSFFEAVLRSSAPQPLRHYFLGTTDDTLAALTRSASKIWPDLTVAGAYAPPFGPVDDEFVQRCRELIGPAHPDIVWVALGTPKQDLLADRLAEALGVPCVAVGAAFDFLAGTKREAPRFVQRLGIEWIYRLATEPRRLWRRYLLGNVEFLLLLLLAKRRRRG